MVAVVNLEVSEHFADLNFRQLVDLTMVAIENW